VKFTEHQDFYSDNLNNRLKIAIKFTETSVQTRIDTI